MKWLKHPNTILLYGIFGFIAGGFIGPYIYASPVKFLWSALDVNDNGIMFMGLLANALFYLSLILGSVTGCILVHSFGKYKRFAAFGSIVFGIIAFVALSLMFSSEFQVHNRRLAVTIYGAGILWSVALVLWGNWLRLKIKRKQREWLIA